MTTRTIRRASPLLLLPLIAASAPMKPAVPAATARGDYVEVRTASVFAGACHYNGERVTEGRSAVLAWSFTGGSADGVDLTGVRVMAAVACDDNLDEPQAARKSELVIDAKTDAAATAAMAWVKARLGEQLGTVVRTRRATVTFKNGSEGYIASSEKFAQLAVEPMPDAGCCNQPSLVWYSPLMAVDGRRVGYTKAASCDAGVVTWKRSDENSAMYGTFGP